MPSTCQAREIEISIQNPGVRIQELRIRRVISQCQLVIVSEF
jgi:hypothetical protein